jgi:hypothetical protein
MIERLSMDRNTQETLAVIAEAALAHTGYASIAEIDVEASPEVVWPVVLDIGAWIYDFHVERVSGAPGEVGEVKHLWPAGAEGLKAPTERRPETATVMKTLTLVPGRLWIGVTPLKQADGKASHAANIVILDDLGGRTRVTAIRSKEVLCPTVAEAEAVKVKSLAYQPIAQARWTEKYLPRLKALAESR